MGGEKLVRQIVDLFLNNTPKRLEEARRGEKRGDFKAVELAVHSLKSSAGNVGAGKLQDLAEIVEELAEKEETDRISALLDELEALFDQVKPLLGEERKGPGA